jgi:hypothetical protein
MPLDAEAQGVLSRNRMRRNRVSRAEREGLSPIFDLPSSLEISLKRLLPSALANNCPEELEKKWMASLKDCGSKAVEPVFWERCPLGGRISRPHVDPRYFPVRLGRGAGPVAQWGTCLDEARAFIAGVRSPPLHGGRAQHRWPHGENPGITRSRIFSEGRGLRARVARPN